MFESSDDIKKAILRDPLDTFVSNEILESVPFAFSEDLKEWVIWKSKLAGLLDVDPKDVVMTGSAALGFSLNPKNDFSAFHSKSDFDCGIISPHHFDIAWRYLRDQQVGWTSLTGEQKRAIRFHRESYIFNGTIATDKILHLLPFGRDWQSALKLVNEDNDFSGRDVNIRIYRDYQSLRHYHLRNLSRLRDDLLSPASGSEAILDQNGDGEEPINDES